MCKWFKVPYTAYFIIFVRPYLYLSFLKGPLKWFILKCCWIHPKPQPQLEYILTICLGLCSFPQIYVWSVNLKGSQGCLIMILLCAVLTVTKTGGLHAVKSMGLPAKMLCIFRGLHTAKSWSGSLTNLQIVTLDQKLGITSMSSTWIQQYLHVKPL